MPANWPELCVVGVLAAWFFGTLVYQFCWPQMGPWVSRFDVFHLLVAWRLFSGFPPDHRLWFRDQGADGAVGPWREIPLRRSRCWHRALWNPDFLGPDALYSYTEFFVGFLPKLAEPRLARKTATRALRLRVEAQPWPAESVRRQFELREVPLTAPGEPKVLYTSPFQPRGGVGELLKRDAP